MNFAALQPVADALLYEGYILYPYRATALKNQYRFNFGVLGPRGSGESSLMRTECLIEGPAPKISLRMRCLQLVAREVFQASSNDASETPTFERVPSLTTGGTVHHSWQEALERDITLDDHSLDDMLAAPHVINFQWDPQQACEALLDPAGQLVGQVRRHQELIEGSVTLRVERLAPDLTKLTVTVENLTPTIDASLVRNRDQALLRSLVSTHLLLGADGGKFVSLLDPPEHLAAAVGGCQQVGGWPVLAGDCTPRNLMLAAPIILYDYPQIAPESGGDFFDGTEIDEMLALRIMTLTDAEKLEMFRTDPRTRHLLQRTESLPPEEWQRLHGAVRQMTAELPMQHAEWGGLEARPRLAAVSHDGVDFQAGMRVRLRPRGRADIMDIALNGKVVIIETIEQDYEDHIHVAVVIEDDPGRDLGLLRLPGHRFFYTLEELEPLETPAGNDQPR